MDRTGTNAEGTGPDFRAPTFTPSTKCEDFLRHQSQQLVKAAVPNGGAQASASPLSPCG
jgi:hypothetical protein